LQVQICFHEVIMNIINYVTAAVICCVVVMCIFQTNVENFFL